jgi:hypothetical protein
LQVKYKLEINLLIYKTFTGRFIDYNKWIIVYKHFNKL